jgi:hypothetical protein
VQLQVPQAAKAKAAAQGAVMRNRKHLHKWQQQRKQELARRERVKNLQAELARAHSLIGRLEPHDNHAELLRLRARVRTLEQQLRYISHG